MASSPLTRLNEVHDRYAGAIPEGALIYVRYGSQARMDLLAAEGSLHFHKGMILGQIRTIRARRADGSFYPELISDLHFYRREFRKALTRRQAVRARIAHMRKEAA